MLFLWDLPHDYEILSIRIVGIQDTDFYAPSYYLKYRPTGKFDNFDQPELNLVRILSNGQHLIFRPEPPKVDLYIHRSTLKSDDLGLQKHTKVPSRPVKNYSY